MRFFFDDQPIVKKLREKGFFGLAKLPSAVEYLFPEKQIRYIKIVGYVAIGITCLWLLDLVFDQGAATSAGPLASAHANFGDNCSKCHDIFRNVRDENCSACHEKSNRAIKTFGVYSFAAHYVYRSNNPLRAKIDRTKDNEQNCRTCHVEHRGRNIKLTAVVDAQCLTCHDFGAFSDEHPEFQFIREQVPDDSSLKFTHIRHVREVLKQEKTQDTETACLYCHNPKFDGKLFTAISYDKHCSNCHLQSVDTSPLPVATPEQAGVFTLASIRANSSIASMWADMYDPGLFETRLGNRLVKKRVVHKDQWIIYNLNQLRRANDLTELSDNSGQLNAFSDIQSQMRMALQKLAGSGNVELQKQISRANAILQRLSVPDSALWRDSVLLNPETESLTQKVAQPCLECHTVEGGSIRWVNGSQAQLVRANFNHRAHIVQRKCLDCHNRIMINPSGADSARAVMADRSVIQNLPAKTECIKCHNGNETTQRCVTCHEFHL